MNDALLDAPLGYTVWITRWREIIATATEWYRQSTGHDPADSDVGHGLWRALAESGRWGTLRGAFSDTWPLAGQPAPTPTPTPPSTQLSNAGEHGRVHVDGFVFRREDGSIFPWIGADSFLLVDKLKRGSVDALLTQLIDPAPTVKGANLVRVFASLDWRNQTGPQFDGGVGPFIDPRDVAATKRAVDACWSRGLRVELSFGDLIKILPNAQDRIDVMHDFGRAFQDHPGIFAEFNEPDHGDQVSAEEAAQLGKILQSYGILTSYGIYNIPFGTTDIPYGDYCTVHDERKPEWPREPRDCSNFFTGWEWLDSQGNVIGHFNGCPVPWVDDESMPADPNSDPSDWAFYGACAALLASGATIHTRQAEYSNLLSGRELACAIEFFHAMRFAPGETKLAPYQRGGYGGGPGVGDMPIEHRDLDEGNVEPRALRTFAKTTDFAYVVAIRPSPGWTAVPRDGWVIVEEPRRGLVKLRR